MANIVSKQANIVEVNKARRERPSGDKVDERLPENHDASLEFEYGANGEYMNNDDRLNSERASNDNPGKHSRNLEGQFTDSSKQKDTVQGDFYKSPEANDRNLRAQTEPSYSTEEGEQGKRE